MIASKIHRYTGDNAAVTWDGKRCIHAQECVRDLPSVFNTSAKPWIQPGTTDGDALAATIYRCPTGALKLDRTDGTNEPIPAHNTANVTANGPTYLRGDLVILDPDGNALLTDTRMALCRCGASQNKPLCDGSHRKIGFQDPGVLHAAESPPKQDGSGPIAIRLRPDGPAMLTGPLTVCGTNARVAFAESTLLCRCGGSQNKPYCDGTHRKIGFVA